MEPDLDDPAIDNAEGGPLSWPAGLATPSAPEGQSAPAVIPPARWASDTDSPCYAHLSRPMDVAPFELTSESLLALWAANDFAELGGDRVLFGLRGCELVGEQWTEFTGSLRLVESTPDHRTRRCVLGVLDRANGRLGAVQGSTVPNADYMFRYVRGIENANLLPTGCYRHHVGHHHPSKPASIVHNVFRLSENVVPLRSPKDMCYTRADFWDVPQNPFDNLHPGGRYPNSVGMEFDSAGCQTAHGGYERAQRTFKGFFAQFRELAGLANPTPAHELLQKFRYVLLTGREARLAGDIGERVGLRRLRFGSRGPAVARLQAALGLVPDAGTPVFGPSTMTALLRRQQADAVAAGHSATADGIVTPALAASLGFSLDA